MPALNRDLIFSFSTSNLDEYLSSHQGRYLFHYLRGRNLSAKTCVLEEKYIDKDYMIDYQKFYPKIRLTFARINRYYIEMKERINHREPYINLGLYLTTIQGYKKSLLESQIKDKLEVLTTSLPRFLWIIRAYDGDQLLRDRIYDGTSVYARTSFIMSIEYEKPKT